MLLDRVEERAVLDGLIEAAHGGLSGALVLYGEAGMGKTTLLDYAGSSAGQLRLARISGIEPEQDFGYAALHRLLLPFLPNVDRLPHPQREGLRSAFGLADHSAADPFLIGLATLTLLADVASPQGLLCVIDDTQWIDVESLQAIAFVGRRLGAEGIALLLGLRSSVGPLPGLAGLASLEIGGLPETSAADLLRQVVGDRFDRRVADHIVAETNGCPLALIELASELSEEQLTGADQLSAPIPIGRRLEEHFVRQIEALPHDSQMVLLIAAAEATGDEDLMHRVASELGCTDGAEETAIRSGLLKTQPRLEFRHPLIRSAVYAAAAPSDRRAVHQALAKAIDREVNPDGWARHMTAITVRPNRELADFLETASQRVRERGGFAAESSLLTQAAEFTQDDGLRAARFVDAAVAAVNAGAPQRAERLLAKARSDAIDKRTMAEALRVEGRMRMQLDQQKKAAAVYFSAATNYLPLDMRRARESMLGALECYLITLHNTVDTDGVEIAQMALSTANHRVLSPIEDLLLDGTSLLLAVGYTESVDLLQKACYLLRNGPVSDDELTRIFSLGMIIANVVFDDQAYIAWIERVESFARKSGALVALQIALYGRTIHHLREGRLRVAEVTLQETVELASAIGMPVDFFASHRVDVVAWQGDEQGTRASAQRLLELGPTYGAAAIEFKAYNALAILELGSGRYAEALEAAQQITSRDGIGWTGQALPLVVEAGVRCGDRKAAEHALAELTVCAQACGTPWALGLLARSQALMAEDDSAADYFEASLGYLNQTLVRTDVLTTHLLYGEWLRRRNRTHEARTHLREAHEAFVDMGAERFAERAGAELMATGERIRRRRPDTMSDLTPQELRVAQLASRGATNPEIAGQLFISSSTVDYHLRKVFRKLEITSRRQLERALQPFM